MWKCPICNNEEKKQYRCQKCGYDQRSDFLYYKTLSPVPKKDIDAWNKNLLSHLKKDFLDSDAERNLRMADTIEKQRRLKKESVDQQQSVPVEKSVQRGSFWKKAFAIFIAMALFGSFMGIFQNVKFTKEQENFQNEMAKEWDSFKETSVQALHEGAVNYEIASIQEIHNLFNNKGYYVNGDKEVPDNIQEGTMVRLRTFTQLGNENSKYEFYVDDWYDSQKDMIEREMYFSDTRRLDNFLENITFHEIHNEMTPLPFDIEFGDSFDEVYEKLGFTEEMVSYVKSGENTENIYLTLIMPEVKDGSYCEGDIYISMGKYTFSYGFTMQNELDHYYVSIKY